MIMSFSSDDCEFKYLLARIHLVLPPHKTTLQSINVNVYISANGAEDLRHNFYF